MEEEGGTAKASLMCALDGVPTRLRCSECETPVCPACFVRTDVGIRCQTCAAPSGPPVTTGEGGGRRTAVLVAVALVVALVVAGGAWAATRGGGSGEGDDVSEGGERVVVPLMTLAGGELPGGATWTLAARREGGVCTVLDVSSRPPTKERCLRTRSYRPVGNSFTRILRGPSETTYLTMGQVSDRTERVRVAPEGAAEFEVPALGGGTGLEIRFFVMYLTSNVPVRYTALGADGTEIGRIDRPKLPTS